MTLENVRLIRDVAYHRSISKGARLSELSQSAASQAIQEVEREAGIELFDRRTRPLTVTDAGKLYVEYCRDVLRRQEELAASINRLKEEVNGRVRVAAIYSVGLSDMAEIEANFGQLYPGTTLEISYLRPERVWESVSEEGADLGLMSYAESSREIVALPWRDEEMVVAVAPDHSLAGRSRILPSALTGEAFIGFDEDLPIQEQISRFLRDNHVAVETTLRFDNIEMIKQAVTHGAGVSIMPKRVMKADIASGRLVCLRLKPANLYRPVRIIHRRRKVFSTATEALLMLLQKGSGQD